jgi:hypothetical protein
MDNILQDAMARAVLSEVVSNPGKYPQTIANTDLATPDYDLDEGSLPTNEAALERAKREGLVVVYPTETELQIDIDNEQSYEFFLRQIKIVTRLADAYGYTERPSKSGMPKRHITVKLKTPVTVLERICLQACLGSDRVREVLGYVRYRRGEPNPTLFFEKPE